MLLLQFSQFFPNTYRKICQIVEDYLYKWDIEGCWNKENKNTEFHLSVELLSYAYIHKRLYLFSLSFNYTHFNTPPGGTSGKEPAYQCKRQKTCGFNPYVGKIPCWRAWQPTPVFLPGESHGQGGWWATIQRVTKSWTWLKWLSMRACNTHDYLFRSSSSNLTKKVFCK